MTENEMHKMQQEAVRRAREMQNRARRDNVPPTRHRPMAAEEPPPEPETVRKSTRTSSEFPKNGAGGVLDAVLKDKEKTLILCLVLLLMEEKSDNSLILALMYLLI